MYTVSEKAERAIKWIDSLSKTRVQTQWKYLGSHKYGYNFVGYGCKILDVIYFPDELYSEEFCKSVGLIDKFGTFHKPYTAVPYPHTFRNSKTKSLRQLSKKYSFRRLASVMRNRHTCYKLFERDVADHIVRHYAEVRKKREKNMIHG